jgi:hypothetical protein
MPKLFGLHGGGFVARAYGYNKPGLGAAINRFG